MKIYSSNMTFVINKKKLLRNDMEYVYAEFIDYS